MSTKEALSVLNHPHPKAHTLCLHTQNKHSSWHFLLLTKAISPCHLALRFAPHIFIPLTETRVTVVCSIKCLYLWRQHRGS